MSTTIRETDWKIYHCKATFIHIDDNKLTESAAMLVTLEECELKARCLPLPERALLIEHLVGSLDELDEAECERLWLEEANRRYEAFKQGRISARPATEVLRDTHARLAAMRQ